MTQPEIGQKVGYYERKPGQPFAGPFLASVAEVHGDWTVDLDVAGTEQTVENVLLHPGSPEFDCDAYCQWAHAPARQPEPETVADEPAPPDEPAQPEPDAEPEATPEPTE